MRQNSFVESGRVVRTGHHPQQQQQQQAIVIKRALIDGRQCINSVSAAR